MSGQALILSLDDDDATRHLRAGLLRGAGYRVLEASGAQEAFARAAAERPDLVILTARLDADSLEICRRLRADAIPASVLVLRISAPSTAADHGVSGFDDGADGCLTDTVEPAVLLATVRMLLRMRCAEQERNEGRTRLAALEEELRRANQVKDEFLATLSHELRTPLNAIVGWSQMLQTGKLTPELVERAVDAIARNAVAQQQLINDMLDVSRITAGRMRLNASVFDLTGALRGAVETLRPAAEAKGLDISLTLAAALPLFGDPDRLQQVFWNLLSNAVKFTPSGGRIDVRADLLPASIEVSVRDTGVGIPGWFLPHVFGLFTQADSSMRRRHHGLGLALVRQLVELHGGTVRAESEGEGRGTMIHLTLPLRLDALAASADPGRGEGELHLSGPAVPDTLTRTVAALAGTADPAGLGWTRTPPRP